MLSRKQPFVLPDSTPRSSKTTINIAGFHVYLYGVDELNPQQARDTTVLFHIHGRTRTYKDAEELAHQLQFDVRQRSGTRKGLIVATLDNRNHGIRAIDNVAIQDWNGGNRTHAQDLLSMTDGIAVDIMTVMKFLESYVDGIFIPTQFIVTGFSLGGHVTWNLLAEECGITTAIVISGSPNLTDLLLERLEVQNSTSSVLHGTRKWPQLIEELYQARDKRMKQITGKNILILTGTVDTLVPSKFARDWVEKYADKNNVTFLEQEETGHWLSYDMMDKVSDWVWHHLL